MNRIDYLTKDGLKIVQNKEVFSFSVDALLLGHFAKVPKKGHIVDLCAGNGAVGLLVSERSKAHITMVELQERLALMAEEGVRLNDKQDQMDVLNIPLQQSLSYIPHDTVDAIVCNPPYFATSETSRQNPNPYLAIARHEIHTNLTDIMTISKQLLKTKGKITLVHRPDRLLDIIEAMTKAGIEAKTLRFIYPKEGKEANMLLIEGIKGGKKSGLKVLPPFVVHQENGEYTDEMEAIFQHG